ncbi:hypothetical protein [Parabacteroides sp.]
MIKQYFKQAIRLLTENKLLSVISILGTALAICMIMVIVILYVVNTAGFKPEVNRGRSYYFNSVMSEGKKTGGVSACNRPIRCMTNKWTGGIETHGRASLRRKRTMCSISDTSCFALQLINNHLPLWHAICP